MKALPIERSSDGVVALLRPHKLTLQEIKLSTVPFIIVLEAVEKPGNLGAILRTADAAKADAVLICDPKTDIYNPNVIRSSVWAVCLPRRSWYAAMRRALAWLHGNNILVYAASLTAAALYHETDFASAAAIVMGTEADGLSAFWLQNATEIRIPMRGAIDSLNVSACTAILTFEAMRQRGFR